MLDYLNHEYQKARLGIVGVPGCACRGPQRHTSGGPTPERVVVGTTAIRESLAGFLAGKPKMSLTSRVVAQADDIAVVGADWRLSMAGADGKRAKATGNGLSVVRRQADGRWLFAIDLPFGPGI